MFDHLHVVLTADWDTSCSFNARRLSAVFVGVRAGGGGGGVQKLNGLCPQNR